MARQKKGNVTPSNEASVLSGRLTIEQRDSLFGVSKRSKRNANYRMSYYDTIIEKVPYFSDSKFFDLKKTLLHDTINSSRNKKCGISQEQLKLLSELPKDELQSIIFKLNDAFLQGNSIKTILQELLPDHKMKVTVTLPANINQWYTEQAKARGMSKSAFLSLVIGKYCEENRNIQKQ
ncbi:MAG: hypothetical protein IJI26_04820 [Clostridia bacterium]|nr:hypothetical protein [Clostridia bacterium]